MSHLIEATRLHGSVNDCDILPFLQPINLGIKRDTASAGYRWTPPDWSRPEGYAWDVRADYSYMTRKGTQAAGIVEFNGFQPTQVPAPVDDNTQNFGASGEYAGTAPWGGKYTFKVAYNGSVYQRQHVILLSAKSFLPDGHDHSTVLRPLYGSYSAVARQERRIAAAR